ncbi:MAG: hypothetical protein GX096_09945 [Clostridiales bacterium]|nr:hypothetical protein [Clostridiales bacterium]
MGKLYTVLRGIAQVITPTMKTEWTTEYDGQPSVFCPNHAGAFGPIDMCAHFPLHAASHPWLNAGMMDAKTVPAYVRQDYWWKPGCFLEPLYNATLPYIAAAILPPVLRSVPGVPVYHDMQVIKTFRKSVEYLRQGDNLVIFAQQPSGYQSHHMELNKGFLQIAPMAYRTLGIALKFYPVHIDYKKRLFTVGEPVQFDPSQTLKEQEQRLIDGIAAGI